MNGLTRFATTTKGTGLDKLAGKEDPVELATYFENSLLETELLNGSLDHQICHQ